MTVEFTGPRFRSDFKAERDRVLKALRECEELDQHLTTTLNELRGAIRRDRGAASLSVRLTEQQIANRNQRLALIKELSHLKKDVLDREFRLAKEAGDAQQKGEGPTAALLQHFQGLLLGPGATLVVLEPGLPDADALIAQRAGTAAAPADPPAPLPAEADAEIRADETGLKATVEPGDIVSDPDGKLWVVTEDGVEDAAAAAAHVELNTGDEPAYAELADGRRVPVVQLD